MCHLPVRAACFDYALTCRIDHGVCGRRQRTGLPSMLRIPANLDQLQHAMSADPQRRREVIELLAGRWTLDVLTELADGGRRYHDLRGSLDGIAHQVLTSTLRRAERDGLIARRIDPGRVETATLYQLTDLGRSLDDLLKALDGWAERNWPHVDAARRRWDRRST